MKKYHVTYFYLATGMEGRADKRDYGIVEAESEKDAKGKIGLQEVPVNSICRPETLNNYTVREYFIGCLATKEEL